jgi:metallo-beta-lactamase class B
MKTIKTLLAIGFLFSVQVAAQNPAQPQQKLTPEEQRKRTEDNLHGAGSGPFNPYQVIGPIWYIGSSGISAWIIKTTDGLILLDTGTEQMEPVLKANAEKIGVNLKDVKIILSGHAHFDHVEGHAWAKAFTGARVMAMGPDAEALESGKDTSTGQYVGWKPVKVDRVLKDGDTVTLGNITLTALHTPGHTKGATSWATTIQDGGRTYKVLWAGSIGVNPNTKLLGNTIHPTVVEDFQKTFRVLKAQTPDIWLGAHPGQFMMTERLKAKESGAANPWIDPDGYKKYIEAGEARFNKLLEDEKAAKPQT